MTAKASNAAKAKDRRVPAASYKNDSINIAVTSESTDADFAVAVARTLTLPQTSAAAVIENWQRDTHDVNALAAELGRQVEAVNGGNLHRAEGLLISQAHALDSIFANLARRATNQERLDHWEAYLRMAMKAQNQCRMTLETLAAIKNPAVVYARQANINNGGQQQVNNGPAPTSTPASAHPGETGFQPNKLLEDRTHGSTQLDTRATAAAGRTHQDMEAVGAVNRAAK